MTWYLISKQYFSSNALLSESKILDCPNFITCSFDLQILPAGSSAFKQMNGILFKHSFWLSFLECKWFSVAQQEMVKNRMRNENEVWKWRRHGQIIFIYF